MQALESILGSVISFLSAGLLSIMTLAGTLFPTGTPAPQLPTTSSIVRPAPDASDAAPATTTPVAAASTPTTSAPAQKPATPAPAAPAPQQTPVQQAPAPSKTQEEINTEARGALVNILCLSKAGINGISGSGIVIDSRGIILTNAHIAQYFLLRNYIAPNNVECTIRVGSPAERRYTARLLYLPPAWVAANASELKSSQATGTGEHDYAFLLITGRTDPTAALPSSFARVEMENAYPDIGDPMLLAAYPAGFLSSEIIERSLYASSAVTYATQLFTYDGDTSKVDLFSIGGTVVSQGGSSGGAVLRLSDGQLAGIIATATQGSETSKRDLRAITLSHIEKSLIAQGKGGIATLLAGDVSAKAAEFNAQVAPGLTAQLEAVLKGN